MKSKDDEDDEPVYLDEETQNPITKKEYDALISRHEDKSGADQGLSPSLCSPSAQVKDSSTNKTEFLNSTQQQEASIGRNPKKRLAKAIANDPQVRENVEKSDNAPPKHQGIPKTRKSKKIKLCFEEDVET